MRLASGQGENLEVESAQEASVPIQEPCCVTGGRASKIFRTARSLPPPPSPWIYSTLHYFSLEP